MTERLYYTDSYLTRFSSPVRGIGESGKALVLDRTAFYPTSGGQQHDIGTLGELRVVDVIDEGGHILHILSEPFTGMPGDIVEGIVDWDRRFDHMQQHTAQHLLSALFADRYQWPTVSVHFGAEYSTIDIAASELTDAIQVEVEQAANGIAIRNVPVDVTFEDARSATGLRKASDREGTLRIISIQGVDRSACGGTHVARTGELGALLLRRVEKTKGHVRVEFLAGNRAVKAARTDYLTVQHSARLLSASSSELPTLIDAQQLRVRDLEREQRRLLQELAGYEAQALWSQATPRADGVRYVHLELAGGQARDRQAVATAITALGKAIVVVSSSESRSILFVTSDDSGVDAGKRLKEALATVDGRGGGSPRVAQGTLSTPDDLSAIVQLLDGNVG